MPAVTATRAATTMTTVRCAALGGGCALAAVSRPPRALPASSTPRRRPRGGSGPPPPPPGCSTGPGSPARPSAPRPWRCAGRLCQLSGAFVTVECPFLSPGAGAHRAQLVRSQVEGGELGQGAAASADADALEQQRRAIVADGVAVESQHLQRQPRLAISAHAERAPAVDPPIAAAAAAAQSLSQHSRTGSADRVLLKVERGELRAVGQRRRQSRRAACPRLARTQVQRGSRRPRRPRQPRRRPAPRSGCPPG
jgi:hypothetical protein